MKKKILLILSHLILSANLIAGDLWIRDDSIHSCSTGSQLSLSYSAGEYISIDRNYTEIKLFSPIFQGPSCLAFLDLCGYRFDNGKWASSLGSGIRKKISRNHVIGLNMYYDYRRTFSQNSCHQTGIGAEWLSHCFDVRINGYLPISKKSKEGKLCVFDDLGDGFLATRKTIEFVYSGFDAEVGTALLKYCGFNVYAAIGPYYFTKSNFNRFWGGLGRLEVNWKSIISVQVRASYDHVHSTKVQGIIQLSIPFDFFCISKCNRSRCKSMCNNLLGQPTHRNGLILTDHCCDWTWNWDDIN